MSSEEDIEVSVETRFVDKASSPADRHYVFAYTITITNRSEQTAQLMNRHWLITDAHGVREEVDGPGVVGKQPVLAPGESFRYTSAAALETGVGVMEGHYEFQGAAGLFRVPIPPFALAVPNRVH